MAAMTPGLFVIAGMLFILALLVGLWLLVWILVAGGSLAVRWAALNPPAPPWSQSPPIDRPCADSWPAMEVWPLQDLDTAVDVPVVCVTRVTRQQRSRR